MREDMYKVIVERPRRWKAGDGTAARLRRDFDGPMRLGTRMGYGRPRLNENLNPLRRYLHAQIGRPWNKVFSEICAHIDRRNTVQKHIHQHIRDFIATDVAVREGRLVDLAPRWAVHRSDSGISQALYVDPGTGLIRPNKIRRAWRRVLAERRRCAQTEIASRCRVVDERTLLMLLDGVWFRIGLELLPSETCVQRVVDGHLQKHVIAQPRYDVVLRRIISRNLHPAPRHCEQVYGSSELFAASKRQISTREIKEHGLR